MMRNPSAQHRLAPQRNLFVTTGTWDFWSPRVQHVEGLHRVQLQAIDRVIALAAPLRPSNRGVNVNVNAGEVCTYSFAP